jgi:hypothetical protein
VFCAAFKQARSIHEVHWAVGKAPRRVAALFDSKDLWRVATYICEFTPPHVDAIDRAMGEARAQENRRGHAGRGGFHRVGVSVEAKGHEATGVFVHN